MPSKFSTLTSHPLSLLAIYYGPYVRLNFREVGLRRGRCQASHPAGLISAEKAVPESEDDKHHSKRANLLNQPRSLTKTNISKESDACQESAKFEQVDPMLVKTRKRQRTYGPKEVLKVQSVISLAPGYLHLRQRTARVRCCPSCEVRSLICLDSTRRVSPDPACKGDVFSKFIKDP